MKKLIYIFFCITALLLAATNMQAQCNPNFTIGTAVTNSTCQANGRITVTLGGDLTNLTGFQYGASSTSGYTVPPSSSNVISNLPPGTYTVTVQAFCLTDNNWSATQSASNVVVGGNYQVPQASLNTVQSRNSYAACPSGKIALNVTGGNGLFTFTVVAGPGVGSPYTVVPTLSGGVYTLPGDTWPAGTYQIQVADSCYSAMANFTLNSISTLPTFTNANQQGFRPDYNNNLNPYGCNGVGWYAASTSFASNADHLRYLNDGMYEIGSAPLPSPGGAAPPASSVTNWTTWTSNNATIWLNLGSNTIKSFYSTGTTTIAIYLRLKNCNSASANFSTYIMNPTSYASSIYINPPTCSTLRTYPQPTTWYHVLCYPLTLTVTQGSSTIYTKTNWTYNADYQTDIPINYANGAYTVTFTDNDGTSIQYTPSYNFSYARGTVYNCNSYNFYHVVSVGSGGPPPSCYPWIGIVTATEAATGTVAGVDTIYTNSYKMSPFALQYNTVYNLSVQYGNGQANYTFNGLNVQATSFSPSVQATLSASYCIANSGYLYLSGSYFAPGTVVETTGPNGYTYSSTTSLTGVASSAIVTPSGVTNTVAPGIYTATYYLGGDMNCGKTVTYNHPGFYDYINFGHTEEPVCGGLQIKPTGTVTYQGNNQPASTFFRLINGPSGAFNVNTLMVPGDSVTLGTSGMYVLGIFRLNNTNTCYLGTDTIYYTAQPLRLDANVTSSYVCVEKSDGEIIVSGINGVPPYTYQIWNADGTVKLPPGDIISYGEAHWPYGKADSTYTVVVIDSCGASFPQKVTMNDLQTQRIVYSLDLEVCTGDSIQLNCITLGETNYDWSGPNSYISSDQNPIIYNADVSMTGWYKVEVWPQYCGSPVADSVYIQVYAPLQAGTVANQTVCAGATPTALACTFSGGKGSYTYQWQSSADGLTGWTNVSGATGATYSPPTNAVGTYYYRKATDDEACGTVYSGAIEFIVKACSAPVNPNLRNLPKS